MIDQMLTARQASGRPVQAGIVTMDSADNTAIGVCARDSLSDVSPVRHRKEPAKPTLPRRLCSLADATRYLAVSDWTVRQIVWRGDLPDIRRGKRVLLDLHDLEGWIDRDKVRGV
jgi:excisionase family DNA binding protein